MIMSKKIRLSKRYFVWCLAYIEEYVLLCSLFVNTQLMSNLDFVIIASRTNNLNGRYLISFLLNCICYLHRLFYHGIFISIYHIKKIRTLLNMAKLITLYYIQYTDTYRKLIKASTYQMGVK